MQENKYNFIFTLPNIVSFLRLISVIIFLLLFYYGRIYYAIIILIFSAITDLLDGFLARVLNQQTPIGSFLDPLADKILVIVTFTIFMIKNYIPWWFFSIIIVREILVSSGWIVIYQYKSTITTKPRFSGKVSIFFQMTTMVLVIFNLYFKNYFLLTFIHKLFLITSFLAIVSIIDYTLYARKIYMKK
ncbi:MAG: CDP-alcohol phosphatidyltransferase family protein [Endomicrobiia bacterium]